MRRLVRIVLRVVAGVLLIVLALLLALRTAPGKRAVLRIALPILNGKMAGHLTVRGIDGDLWHRVVLVDARLDDSEGVEAIYARRIEARVDVRALWDRRLHIRDLRVDGARLTMRHLTDNRFNFAALAKPTLPTEKTKSSAQQPPPLVEIDHFVVQVDGAYHPPRGHESHPLEWPRGSFDIEGAARFRGAEMHFRVDRFVSDSRDPLRAHVELHGGLAVTPHAAPRGKVEVTFEDVEVTAVSDGRELRRLHPLLRPIGRWQVHAKGGGPLADLHAGAIVSGPRGTVSVDGMLTRMFPGVRWQARVVGVGLDPAADWQKLPRGQVDFELRGSGARRQGSVTVARLDGRGSGITVAARGQSDFGGRGAGVVHASIDSLARLGEVGVRIDGIDELDGRVRLVANLGRDAAGPRLDASARGDGVWMRHGRFKTTARLVEASAIVRPKRPMHVRVGGHDLELAGVFIAKRSQPFTLRIRELATVLDGHPRRFIVDSSAELADGTRSRVVARATLAAHAADVTLTTATLDRNQLHFALAEPARLHLSGSAAAPRIRAAIAGARLDARVRFGHDLFLADAALALPDVARVARLAGIDAGGTARIVAHVALAERLTLAATVDGERLHGFGVAAARLHASVHSVDLVGDARLDGERLSFAGVTLSRFGAQAHGTRERLSVTLDGERRARGGPERLQLEVDGRWRTDGRQVVDADLWLRATRLTLPGRSWLQVSPAHLVFRRGAATLDGLRIRSDLGELSAEGRWVHGTVDVALEARAARTFAWLGFGVNALTLRAFADAHHALLHADARGRGDTRVIVDARGAPRSAGEHITGVAATLERVQISVHGHTWLLREPCDVDVGARIDVGGCRLGAPGRGEIALSGSAPLSRAGGDVLDLTLHTRHLDLRDLHALLAPGHRQPPKTDFEIHAHLAGTRRAPVADVQLSGRGAQIDEGGLPENVNYKISAHYEGHRVRGQVSMRQAGMRLGIGATFDLPTTLADGEQPIALALEARPVPFYKIRQLLPTPIANLKGFFTLRANATGTTRHPRVTAELHMPSWGLDDLRDNNTIVDLAYDGRALTINSVTSLHAQGLLGAILRLHPPRNSGTVTMELRAPVDVVRLLSAPRDALHALVHDAPIVASAEVRNVDVRKLPLQIVGFDAPVTSGRLNAAARAGGTLHRPSLHVDFRAVDLGKPGLVDRLDLDGSLEWERARVKLSGRAALRGAPLLTFRGEAALDGRQLFDGDGWRTGTLLLDVDVPSFELARLRGMEPRLHAVDGTLQAHAQLRGTFAAPDLRIAIQGRDVGIAHARFTRIGASARLYDRRWRFDVVGIETGGGEAHVAGELASDWEAPLRMSIDARALDVGFLGALWAEIGEVRGTLGAHVDVSGSRLAPRPVGWARLDGGQFAFRRDGRRYEGELEVRIDGNEARLTRLVLRGGGGTLDATGRAQLEGILPTQLSLAARAHAFTFAYGSAEARFDADFELAGDRSDGVFRGQLALSRGSIKLPDLGGLGATDELADLGDVRFDDARARGNEGRRRAGKGAFIVVRVAGPLELRSKEADLDLSGELGVTVAGGALGIEGVVEGQRGTVELLGKRYDVERAQLAFGGAPDDPELHLRVTRRIGKATVAVVIEGTAKNPSVRLSCDPPVYDDAQLTSLILAGRAGTERIAIRELNRQISGLLSAVVIRKIQEQLAPGLPVDVSRPLDQQSYAEFSAAPIEVGRFVSDRIYVRYEQRYGGSRLGRSAANAEEASADYRLGKGFQLSTSFGDAGVGGVYLLWTAKH